MKNDSGKKRGGPKALSEFRAACDPIVSVASPNEQVLSKFVTWIVGDGENVLKEVFAQEFQVKFGKLSDGALIEAGIPSTSGETLSKLQTVAFYHANYLMPRALFEEIAAECAKTSPRFDNTQLRVVYALTRATILDSLTLVGDFAEYKLDIGNFSMRAVGSVNPLDLVRAAAASSWGSASLEPHTAIPLFRCALEMRIRRALGLVAKIRKTDLSPLPVNLTELLEAVEKHESDFRTSVPLRHIRRANSWANLYVHMALRCYAWQPRFVVRYFSAFLLGEPGTVATKKGRVQSIHSGVQTTKIVLGRIRRSLDKTCGQNEEFVWLPPEQCDLVLTG